MNITLITPTLQCGGAERVVSLLAQGFFDRGYTVNVITFSHPSTNFYELPAGVTLHSLDMMGKSNSTLEALSRNVDRLGKLRQTILATKPDRMITLMPQTNILSILTTLGTGIPIYVTEHCDVRLAATNSLWERLRRWVYPWATQMVSVSDGVDRGFDFLPAKKRSVIYNPVVPQEIQLVDHSSSSPQTLAFSEIPGADPSRPWVVSMGRLRRQKGYDLLIPAFAKLADRYPDWQLIILGEGNDRAALEKLRDDLGLRDRIVMPGSVKNTAAVLKQAELFVMASRFEGFPMAHCEAMSSGLPIVSTDCESGPREIIRHGVDGLLVPPENIEALAEGLETLMSNALQREQFAQRAPDVLDRFGMNQIIAEWEQLMKSTPDVSQSNPSDRIMNSDRTLNSVQSPKFSDDSHTVFLVRQLNYGGAQRQLVTLAKGLHDRGQRVTVLSFYDHGKLDRDLIEHQVPIISLGKTGRWDNLFFFGRLLRELYRLKPTVLHGYLGIPNLFAVLLKPFLPRTRIVWGVRESMPIVNQNSRLSRTLFQIDRRFSRWADLIILNSHTGKVNHRNLGYPQDKMVVISNGIDTDRFAPNDRDRHTLRQDWNLEDREIIIGCVGRLHRMKDHMTFIKAAAILHQTYPQLRFVCVGTVDGPHDQDYAQSLKDFATDLDLDTVLEWREPTHQIEAVYNAIDILALTSCAGEGFPNVLGEAMACGTPCVSTTTGDSEYVLGDFGEVAPPGDAIAIARAIERQLAILTSPNFDRAHHQSRLRQHILQNFSVRNLVEKTERTLLRT